MAHNFPDLDKHQQDQELRDRIRAVIRGLETDHRIFIREALDNVLAHLQPSDVGTNIDRLEIGIAAHWDNRIYSNRPDKLSCVLVLLRQLIINYWDYLLGGSDESLKPDGQIENHLETLEGYVEDGLENYVVAGDVRQGYWLMNEGEYRAMMEEVR